MRATSGPWRLRAVAAGLAVVGLLVGCQAVGVRAPWSAPVTPAAGSALALLPELAVRGRSPRTGYDRAKFGPAWADVDHNGCDTRNDILRRDLTGRTVRPGTHGCVVLSGTLADPYTGRELTFSKAHADAVQIDHVVALSDAWQKGAAPWTLPQREQLANDPLNLLAVDGPANQQKGDGDAATWLPANQSFRCAYVARQLAVKVRYGLAATPAERDAIRHVLGRCPGEPAPAAASPPGPGPPGPATATPGAAAGLPPTAPSTAPSSARPRQPDAP